MSSDKTARLAAIRAANAARRTPPSDAPATEGPLATPAARGTDDILPPTMALPTLFSLLAAAIAGALGAVFVLPAWLPALSASLLGDAPHAYWYLARSSAIVAYVLLWLSTVAGLLMTSKLARLWQGGPMAFDLHQHASLLGLAFAMFHAFILLGDRYIQADLRQLLVPFAYAGHQPLWVGLGQIGLYLLALVGLSFYIKSWIGRGAWRLIHFLSFALFVLVLLHGIFSGSDSANPWVQSLYWTTGGSVLFLFCYRLLRSVAPLRRHSGGTPGSAAHPSCPLPPVAGASSGEAAIGLLRAE
ncbi:MAG: hypothetical protein RMK84_01420 [Oscillochloridaceae bacterium]|nr:hypothetical protein [Chloroflexaceae bacterium]MDW8388759.1 hypothetical protein [Oscillochloridaceae bacterium]